MITVIKTKAPDYLKSSKVLLAKERMNNFYVSKNRSQKRYNFPFNKEINRKLIGYLAEEFHDKCGYCETKIESYNLGVIDRYRPHNGIRDKNEYFKDLYWWLTFDWNNLIYSCKECSQYKANYFPIAGIRAEREEDDLDLESSLILNPCEDNPEEHLQLLEDLSFYGKTEKGLQTIELLKLNRPSLIKGRQHAINILYEVFEKFNRGNLSVDEKFYLNAIFERRQNIEYLFTQRIILLNELDSNRFLRELIQDHEGIKLPKVQYPIKKIEQDNRGNTIKSEFFPIECIKIKNFKSISNLTINFPENIDKDNYGWLVLLGENGLGKSSILQAICLGLKHDSFEIDVSKFIKHGAEEAKIEIKERDSDNILTTKLNRADNTIEQEGIFSSPLIGYGSTRLLPNDLLKPEEKQNRIRYKNLFNPSTPISDIFGWLNKVYEENSTLFDTIAYSLNQILPEEKEENLTISDGKLFFVESRKSFDGLSAGYQNTIALALDIMYSLSDGNTDMDKLTGIVLIDELGNQLHPRWQMEVVQQFRTVFPRVNFIVSTHHPLCLRGLRENEVTVLRKDENEDIYIIQDLPNPNSLRVDQILTSPYFGLHSAIDPKVEELFNEYYDLLAKNDLTNEQENKKLELSDKIPKLKFLGDTLREELAIYAIDKLLAEKRDSQFDMDKLKEEAKLRVKDIWDDLDKIGTE